MKRANCACPSKVNFSLEVSLMNTLRRLLMEGCSFSTSLNLAYLFYRPPSPCRYDLFISSGRHHLLLPCHSTKGGVETSIINCSTLDSETLVFFLSLLFLLKGYAKTLFLSSLCSLSLLHATFFCKIIRGSYLLPLYGKLQGLFKSWTLILLTMHVTSSS